MDIRDLSHVRVAGRDPDIRCGINSLDDELEMPQILEITYPFTDGVSGQISLITEFEFQHDPAAVGFNCFRTYIEIESDLLGVYPFRYKPDNLQLSWRKCGLLIEGARFIQMPDQIRHITEFEFLHDLTTVDFNGFVIDIEG